MTGIGTLILTAVCYVIAENHLEQRSARQRRRLERAGNENGRSERDSDRWKGGREARRLNASRLAATGPPGPGPGRGFALRVYAPATGAGPSLWLR
jgi:hypothetical protein